ncbi:hypothetical protein [Enhygromyxa salina]|uniref:hypothetical protein n=1 Tax=Enhygromyxa salina TaxID=215803 RepID=UPI000695FC21|nr:hypothetical protein [Enhygromyxa salina]
MPASYREITAALLDLGLEIKERGRRRGKGSHAEVRTAEGKFVTVLGHHNQHDQLNNSSIKSLSRRLAEHIDGLDADAWVTEVTGRPSKTKKNVAAK